MGVYEVQAQNTPGMHWQQHPERHHQMLAAAYDPSRGDLSPNLPTTCQDTGGSMSSGSSSGLTSCCSFKTEEGYDQFGSIGCRSCGPEDTSSGFCRKSCQQEERREFHAIEPKREPLPVAPLERGTFVCAACGLQIKDRYLLSALDRRWHERCLQCCQCRINLDSHKSCYTRDGKIFCKTDYFQLFSPHRCGRCQSYILPTHMVMRARDTIFHQHCFVCAVCQHAFIQGDTFTVRNGAVFCHLHQSTPIPQEEQHLYPGDLHYHPHPRLGPHSTPPPNLPLSLPSTPPEQLKGATAFFNGAPTPRQKGRPRKRKPKDLESMAANLDLNAEAYLDVAFGPGTPGMGGANGSHHQRTKRMRTSFKHHQLRTMKSYFAINHNPDAKDLKQLSQKTGLPKRVLQVWFQNARAKWRRMMLKSEAGGGKSGDKCGEGAGGSLEAAYHLPPHGSPHQYLSPSPLECSS